MRNALWVEKGNNSTTHMKSANKSRVVKYKTGKLTSVCESGRHEKSHFLRPSSAVLFNPKRPVSFLTYARSRLLTQLSSPRVQRDARHGALALNDFSSQSTGLARTISVRTEVALVKLVNVLADG